VLAVPGLLSTYFASGLVGPTRGTGLYQGFAFWSVFAIPGLKGADHWLSGLPGTWTVLGFLALAVAVGVMLAVLLFRRPAPETLGSRLWIVTAAATTMFAYPIAETVQPQYLVWVLPFLALLAVRSRRHRLLYVLFSVIPAAFYFLLDGPLLNFLPLWYNYHVISYAQMQSSVSYWLTVQNITLPALEIPAFVCTVTITILLFWELLRKAPVVSAFEGEAV